VEETFGEKLRNLRRSGGVSQRDLAKRVGVDFSYISKLENDRLPPPSAETMLKICEVLGTSPDELFAATGKILPDIQQSISTNLGAIRFLRTAQEMNLTDAEWERLDKQLKRLRK
jgi:HTH-type transcriptional regulator, competence development regulator